MIEEICRLAEKNKVQKVILFGSRARGDFRERSDIDIAFYGGKDTNAIITHRVVENRVVMGEFITKGENFLFYV